MEMQAQLGIRHLVFTKEQVDCQPYFLKKRMFVALAPLNVYARPFRTRCIWKFQNLQSMYKNDILMKEYLTIHKVRG